MHVATKRPATRTGVAQACSVSEQLNSAHRQARRLGIWARPCPRVMALLRRRSGIGRTAERCLDRTSTQAPARRPPRLISASFPRTGQTLPRNSRRTGCRPARPNNCFTRPRLRIRGLEAVPRAFSADQSRHGLSMFIPNRNRVPPGASTRANSPAIPLSGSSTSRTCRAISSWILSLSIGSASGSQRRSPWTRCSSRCRRIIAEWLRNAASAPRGEGARDRAEPDGIREAPSRATSHSRDRRLRIWASSKYRVDSTVTTTKILQKVVACP